MPEWIDVWGEPQTVATDDLLAALEALTRQQLTSEAQVAEAEAEFRNEEEVIPPVVVAWDGKFPDVAARRPVDTAVIVTESGQEIPAQTAGPVITLDQRLPYGYHQLRPAGTDPTSLVISAPITAHPAPSGALGVLAPVYSMRSEAGDAGIGHFGYLERLADIAMIVDVSVIGTLPLVATFPDQPSPYAPASRRAWNEILIDLAAAPGWEGKPPVRNGDPRWVDYTASGDAIRDAIGAYAAHTHTMPEIRAQIERFAADHPEMARYAIFRARSEQHGRNWRTWPAQATASPQRIDYHLTAQWLATRQLKELGDTLRARGQYLYLDLPIGCHPDGYDIWDQPDLYAAASVGAPPDSLFLGGQDWGLPAPIPQRSRRDGHRAFIKAVRHQLSVAGLLRIDHVMGLHRSWWVPHGLSATQGAYVMQPTDEMFAIVCLESHRAGAAVVGENLGTVPPAISTALECHQLLGMKVAQDGLKTPDPHDLIALSTHDTAPFAAWWKQIDIDDAEDLGVYADGRGDVARSDRSDTIAYLEELFSTSGYTDTRDAILEWMAASPAAIAIINIDDLWAEERRQNVPGTDRERPNWRARHAKTLEELAADERIRTQLETLHQIRAGSR